MMSHRFNRSEQEELKAIFTDLVDQPAVYNASDRDDVENGLRELEISRDVKHEELPLAHLHRVVDGIDVYFLYNHGDTAIKGAEIELRKSTGSYVPFIMDAWAGNLVKLRNFSDQGEHITTTIHLKPKSAVVIGIGPKKLKQHFTNDYKYAYQDLNKVEQISLDGWKLVVQEWLPGDTPITTRKQTKRLTLNELTSWDQIDALKDTSGIGVYQSTFALGNKNTRHAIILDFGELNDLILVKVNGTQTDTIDPYNAIADITKLVKPGRNKIEVEVCTTLNNQLRISNPDVFANNKRQKYGLTHPVSVCVYEEV